MGRRHLSLLEMENQQVAVCLANTASGNKVGWEGRRQQLRYECGEDFSLCHQAEEQDLLEAIRGSKVGLSDDSQTGSPRSHCWHNNQRGCSLGCTLSYMAMTFLFLE